MAQMAMETSLELMNGGTAFSVSADNHSPLIVDYASPDAPEGYSPMQLFLFSLSSCTAISLATLMQDRMRTTVSGLAVRAIGQLRMEHPKSFSHIEMRMTLYSQDATDEKVLRALNSVEEKICPVMAMIKGNVEVDLSCVIERP